MGHTGLYIIGPKILGSGFSKGFGVWYWESEGDGDTTLRGGGGSSTLTREAWELVDPMDRIETI